MWYMVTQIRTTSARPAEVWARLADVEHWPGLLPTVTSAVALDPGRATGVGSRFRLQQPGLPVAVWTVTTWEPERRFVWTSRGPGVLARASHALRDHGDRTELRLQVTWTGIAAPLMRVLLERRARDFLALEAAAMTGAEVAA